MSKFKVGIIGCGRPRGMPGWTGFGMAHRHAAGYEASPDAEIVAIAEIVPFNREKFCEEHNVPRSYATADEMLANEELDIVSIALWPDLHAPTTIQVAESGIKAIHCEKPMATTFGDAKAMVAACKANGVQLTFNHMRRFGDPFRKAKELLDNGAIGQLERVEAYTSNLYDWGTHWLDMMFFYNDDTPAEWVLGQIDARGGPTVYGVIHAGHGLSTFKWQNGVMGMIVTGKGREDDVRSTGCANRLIGSAGTIEVGVSNDVQVRLRNAETGGIWQTIPVDGGMHGDALHIRAILDNIDALKTGREPELAARKALQSTEITFATWESSRRRGRVDLPLDVDDSPLKSMLDMGDVTSWYDGTVEANGIRQHYWRTGDGSKPALVMCHGVTDNGLCWTPVARALEKEFDVVMVDARGHGFSDAPDSGYTTEDRADDVAALIQALGLEKPIILGHSMGGATAGFAAMKYPGIFSKVILEDPGWWEQDSRRQTMPEKERQAFVKTRRAEIIRRSRLTVAAQIADNARDRPGWSAEELGNWALAKQQVSPKIVSVYTQARPQWRDVARGIQCPALLITAEIEKGAIVTPAMAEEAREINPNIRVAHIDGADHNIRRAKFEAYMNAITAFLHTK